MCWDQERSNSSLYIYIYKTESWILNLQASCSIPFSCLLSIFMGDGRKQSLGFLLRLFQLVKKSEVFHHAMFEFVTQFLNLIWCSSLMLNFAKIAWNLCLYFALILEFLSKWARMKVEKGMRSDVFVLEREKDRQRGEERCYFWHIHADAKFSHKSIKMVIYLLIFKTLFEMLNKYLELVVSNIWCRMFQIYINIWFHKVDGSIKYYLIRLMMRFYSCIKIRINYSYF